MQVNNIAVSARALALALLTALVCLCVHESGHALAGVVTGGKVTQFVLISTTPHVRIQGAATAAQQAWKAAAGSALFLTAWFGVLFVLPRRWAWSVPVRVSSVFVMIELLGWGLTCLQVPGAGQTNDAAKFLRHSGANSWLMALACALIGAAGYCLLRAKRTQLPVRTRAR